MFLYPSIRHTIPRARFEIWKTWVIHAQVLILRMTLRHTHRNSYYTDLNAIRFISILNVTDPQSSSCGKVKPINLNLEYRFLMYCIYFGLHEMVWIDSNSHWECIKIKVQKKKKMYRRKSICSFNVDSQFAEYSRQEIWGWFTVIFLIYGQCIRLQIKNMIKLISDLNPTDKKKSKTFFVSFVFYSSHVSRFFFFLWPKVCFVEFIIIYQLNLNVFMNMSW